MLRSITNDVCEQFPHLETTVVAINSVQIYIVAVSLTLQTGLYMYSVQTSKQKLETTTVFAVDVVLNRKDAETNCEVATERPPYLHYSLTRQCGQLWDP